MAAAKFSGPSANSRWHAVFHLQSLRPQGGGHHGHTVGERLEDLHPRPAAVTHRHNGHRCTSQLPVHRRDLADHRQYPGLVQLRHARDGTADQSHLGRRLAGSDAGCDGVGEPLRPVDVGRVPEASLEEDDRRPVRGRVSGRPPRPGVRVGDHGHVGQCRPGGVELARDHDALHLRRHRPLESAPVAGVEPGLVPGHAGPHGTPPLGVRRCSVSSSARSSVLTSARSMRSTTVGPRSRPTRPVVRRRGREPHQVIGRSGPVPQGKSGGVVGSGHDHLERHAAARHPVHAPPELGGRPGERDAHRACHGNGRRHDEVGSALVVEDEEIEVAHRRQCLHDLRQAHERAPSDGHGVSWATSSDLTVRSPFRLECGSLARLGRLGVRTGNHRRTLAHPVCGRDAGG